MQIEGQGKNNGAINRARVNSESQLEVRSVCSSEVEHSVLSGDAFQAYTGLINLANANKTAILYIQNNDVADIMLTTATLGTNQSTGGADSAVLVEAVGNVIASDDIVLNGADVLVLNRNGGSPRSFEGIAKKGASLAAANGVASNGTLSDLTGAHTFNLTTVVPKGGAVALEVTPPAGNTSMNITATVGFHVVESV